MERIILFGAFLALLGCASGPELGDDMGLPGQSFVNISPSLYSDVTRNLAQWLQAELDCDSYVVENTEIINQEGSVLMDNKGRLFSGVITESWHITACGSSQKIGLVMQPDGIGGSYVAIASSNE